MWRVNSYKTNYRQNSVDTGEDDDDDDNNNDNNKR
jgi:hypothetical protein